MNSNRLAVQAALLIMAASGLSSQAQFNGGDRRWPRRGYEIRDPEMLKEKEEMEKAINPAFKEDVFTFARLKFNADLDYRFGGGRQWDDDTPSADLNLVYRMYQVTSLKMRPGLNFIDITTNDLERYPLVYLASAGRLVLEDVQIKALRDYLLNGGFMMADDFWGDDQWRHFRAELKKVFPKRDPVEIHLDDPIFHTVFDFKQEPQIPSVGAFMQTRMSYDPGWPYFEKDHGPHYYALYDDKHRMMALLCHNNHYGDGWEHEGDDESYFDDFSEPMAYPMLINILFYTTTN